MLPASVPWWSFIASLRSGFCLLLSKEQNVQVCDARDDDNSTIAGFKKSNNFKLSSQNSIQNKIPVTMSYKVSAICLKVLLVAAFLLQLQPAKAQYNWSDLDAELLLQEADQLQGAGWINDSLS